MIFLLRIIRVSLLTGLLGLTGTAAQAQFESDSSAPIEITADTMEWMHEEQIAIARGNADAIQGRYHLHADVLTAHIAEGADGSQSEIKRLDAEGNVILRTPEETATGEIGVYDVDKGEVELVGRVVLTQGENVMRGARLVMDLNTGVSRLDGGAGQAGPATSQTDDGRVRAIFTPDKNEE